MTSDILERPDSRTVPVRMRATMPLAHRQFRRGASSSGALGSRIAQLMVIDRLFTAVAQAAFDESMTAIRTTYEAVHSRSLKGS